MKDKIKRLKSLVDTRYQDQGKRRETLIYLSVCFLGFDGENVARYFGMKYTRVRHHITVCGLKLQKSKYFMAKMHEIAKEYNVQQTLKLAV